MFHLKKNLLRKNVLSPFPFSAPIFRSPFSGPSPAFLRSSFPLASLAAKMMKVSACWPPRLKMMTVSASSPPLPQK